jgi:hypothetical protein
MLDPKLYMKIPIYHLLNYQTKEPKFRINLSKKSRTQDKSYIQSRITQQEGSAIKLTNLHTLKNKKYDKKKQMKLILKIKFVKFHNNKNLPVSH